MRPSLPWLADALQELHEQGLYRRRRTTRFLGNGECEVDGRCVRDFASNDYLNLAGDPRVIAAATAAMSAASVGARASPLISGRSPWHAELERRIASFEGQPDALVFPTGMAANVGTIGALCGRDDLIVADRLNHASLVDGCRLSGAQVRVYRHDDLPTLVRELQKGASARRRWIVTDTVFSMDGELAPLPELCDIAQRYDASLIVDEAHGTGVFGERGRGTCEALQVEDRVAVCIGTLSKAVGTQGGFVAGSAELIEYLWNRSRTLVYSTGLSPAVCAAATVALSIIADEPWRRERLHTLSRHLRSQLTEHGIESLGAAECPIVPVILQDPHAAVEIAAKLEQRGYVVGAIRPPTVPRDTSRLRIVVSCVHEEMQLAELAAAIGEEVTAAGLTGGHSVQKSSSSTT